MHYLIAFIYFLFALIGIDGHGSHTIVRHAVSHGVDVLYSRTRVIGGLAEVACISSASGVCHYRLLPGECLEPAPQRALPTACAGDKAAQFVLPAGASRELSGWSRGAAICVSVDHPVTGSDCDLLAAASAGFP